jgi:8-oxo-dGTP diphosphatase
VKLVTAARADHPVEPGLPQGAAVGPAWTTSPPGDIETGSVRAAGAVVWRRRAELEVALVHRPKYADWSWPKGKLEAGESWAGACVREVREETGLDVVLGMPLPDATYTIGSNGTSRPKVVRYWAAQVRGDRLADHGAAPASAPVPLADTEEVDAVAWLTVDEAARRLDYHRDRAQLQAVASADALGRLDTWPLAVVRHAKSVPRSRWKHSDPRRPLTDAGHARAALIVPVLAAYGLQRVVSSPSARCAQTLDPYADATGARMRLRDELSEEGFADDPSGAASVVGALLDRGTPAAVCSHRPVLPAMLAALADRCADSTVSHALRESAGPGMVKGEVLVAHVSGSGPDATVVAVERHDTR